MIQGLSNSEKKLKISAVSQITGIPADTLRAWERRHDILNAPRAKGTNRLYSQDDVEKLTLVKLLVDRGHAISNVANLDIPSLEKLLQMHNKEVIGEKAHFPLKLCVIGDILAVRLRHKKIQDKRIKLVGLFKAMEGYRNSKLDRGIDIMVVEYGTLQNDSIQEILKIADESGAKKIIVVYGFGSQKNKSFLEKKGILVRQAPIDMAILIDNAINSLRFDKEDRQNYSIEDKSTIQLGLSAPNMFYSRDNLAYLAAQDSPLKCECPQHLADLIISLNRFEIYSAECENRNDEDAEVHAMLNKATGHSRAILENALKRVIEHEGLQLLPEK